MLPYFSDVREVSFGCWLHMRGKRCKNSKLYNIYWNCYYWLSHLFFLLPYSEVIILFFCYVYLITIFIIHVTLIINFTTQYKNDKSSLSAEIFNIILCSFSFSERSLLGDGDSKRVKGCVAMGTWERQRDRQTESTVKRRNSQERQVYQLFISYKSFFNMKPY